MDTKRWTWDLFPLSRNSYGNQQLNVGEHTGQIVTRSRRQAARVQPLDHSPRRMVDASRDAYVPTDNEIALARRLLPGQADPGDVPWHLVEARLLASGHDKKKVGEFNAPALLLLLERAEVASNAAMPAQAVESFKSLALELLEEVRNKAQPATAPVADDAVEPVRQRKAAPPLRAQEAMQQYDAAADALGKASPTDREAFDQLVRATKQEGSRFPHTYATWSRYLRIARRKTNTQKHRTQAKSGRSITGLDGVDPTT